MAKPTLDSLFNQQHQDLTAAQDKLKVCESKIEEQVNEVEKLKQQLQEAQEKLEKSQGEKIDLLMAITGKTREDIIDYLETAEEAIAVETEKTLTPSSKEDLEKKALTLSNLSTRIISSKENIPFGPMIEDAVAEKATANISFANELLDALKEGVVPGDATVSKIDLQLDEFIKNSNDVLDHTKEIEVSTSGGVEIVDEAPVETISAPEVAIDEPSTELDVATETEDLSSTPRPVVR